ncbi:hypothetical protein ABZ826_33185 [Streptomyces sp. NPDC047515]|uniref:hypothetical protein n=1 Tax=Streptomyces sp. NPDC047515 TaxID=3155380 RepID=UPI0033ED72CF
MVELFARVVLYDVDASGASRARNERWTVVRLITWLQAANGVHSSWTDTES